MDVANCIADAWYRLGFISQGDIGGWVTADELYTFADEAAQKLAYLSGILTTYDTSITVTSSTAVYNEPAAHVFTLAAWLGSSPLRLTPVRDLWALDAQWQGTSGAATRASMDANGVGTITLYPNPSSGGTLNQVTEEYASTIASGSSTISLPSVLQDWLSYEILRGARAKESDARMDEMADHYEQRCNLYLEVVKHLWGTGH